MKKPHVAKKVANWFSEQKELLSEFRKQVKTLKKEREEKTVKTRERTKDNMREIVKETRTKVDISVGSVIKAAIAVALVALSLYLLYAIKDIVVLVLTSFFIAAMLSPIVDFLEKKKIPRGFGVVISYFCILTVLIFCILAIVPVLKSQGDKLTSSIIGYLQNVADHGFTSLSIPFVSHETEVSIVNWLNGLKESVNLDLVFEQSKTWLIDNQASVGKNLETVATNFFGVLNNVASGLGNIVVILLLTFFIIVEKSEVRAFLLAVLPPKYRGYFIEKVHSVQEKIGGWVKGQFLLGLTVGIATYIGFLILALFGLHIEEMGILSVIAALTEVIPVIGPILAGLISVLVAANLGVVPMVIVAGMFILIQQLENNILVPVIMRHAVGLSSFVIIIGMLIGVEFLGFLGLILAVPVTTIIGLFIQDFINGNEKKES